MADTDKIYKVLEGLGFSVDIRDSIHNAKKYHTLDVRGGVPMVTLICFTEQGYLGVLTKNTDTGGGCLTEMTDDILEALEVIAEWQDADSV